MLVECLIYDHIIPVSLQDPNSRVACETCTKTDMVMVFGEITTKAKVDYEKIVRDTVQQIGFTSSEVGLDGAHCKVRVSSNRCQEMLCWIMVLTLNVIH